MFCNLFLKGLWDHETIYMDRYFPREVLLANHTRANFIDGDNG